MIVRLKRCPHCGRNEPRDAASCSGCHSEFAFRATQHRLDPSVLPPGAQWVAPAPHDISLAALGSIFLVGVGQMYNRQSLKGALLMFVTFALLVAAGVLWSDIVLMLAVVVWAVSIVDATVVANRVLNQERVRPWQWF